MACINPDGTLTEVARKVLTALRTPMTASEAAKLTGLPLWRIRATVRETGHAGLITPIGDAWKTTPLGEEALELSELGD